MAGTIWVHVLWHHIEPLKDAGHGDGIHMYGGRTRVLGVKHVPGSPHPLPTPLLRSLLLHAPSVPLPLPVPFSHCPGQNEVL